VQSEGEKAECITSPPCRHFGVVRVTVIHQRGKNTFRSFAVFLAPHSRVLAGVWSVLAHLGVARDLGHGVAVGEFLRGHAPVSGVEERLWPLDL
jgi:hypothetical protein